jgi:hypothetical protein
MTDKDLSTTDRLLAEKLAGDLPYLGWTIPAEWDDIQERSEWSWDVGRQGAAEVDWQRFRHYQAENWPAVKALAKQLASDPTFLEGLS